MTEQIYLTARFRRVKPKRGRNRRLRLRLGAVFLSAAILAVSVKTLAYFGSPELSGAFFGSIPDAAAARVIDAEKPARKYGFSLESLLLGAAFPKAMPSPEPEDGGHAAAGDVPDDAEPPQSTPAPTDGSGGGLFYTGGAKTPDYTVDNSAPLSAEGINIFNKSGLKIDIGALLREPLEMDVAADAPNVLIIHTHTSEAYTPTALYPYTESDPYRTQDPAANIVAVGDALKRELESYGLNVIHDTGVYDYPSYSGSYNRTLEAVRGYLAEYPTITCVFDVHRNAIEGADGKQYKTIAEVDGRLMSQILLFVGTNSAGLEHPKWSENLKYALRLEYEMNRLYPTLARPITVSNYRYNQHLTERYLILEVGSAGNTLEESLDAIPYFAEAFANVALAGSRTETGAPEELPVFSPAEP
ncbi:MAG: stage II sporulation protein P [Oscillospiraceae bacterium]|jgi:stage II sporulation protein P|nr:stage II sporulation protein P [Oscillospiraceae bacterium]